MISNQIQTSKQPGRVNLQESFQLTSDNVHYNGGNQQRSSRTYRIFRDQTPILKQNSTTPKKIYNTAGTNDTTNSFINNNSNNSRLSSPTQGCYIYYDKGYGLNRSNHSSNLMSSIKPLSNQLSPQKFKLLKTTQMLQYENSLLMKQLQDRDNIILMYKKGFTRNPEPFDEVEIKNLNLRLAQKNTLIQQFHRSLAQFQQTVKQQQLQISPICMQRFKVLQELVYKHDHYPVIIKERILDPTPEIHVNSWQIKMQKSYHQLTSIKQRLDWFEKQNYVLRQTIDRLKTHECNNQNNNSSIQIQKLNNHIIILQQHIQNYKIQITDINKKYDQLKKKYENEATNKKILEEIETLKTQNKFLQQRIVILSKNEAQLFSLRQNFEKLKQQNVLLNKRQIQYTQRISDLQNQLKNKINQNNQTGTIQRELSEKKEQIKNLYYRISQLDKQLQLYILKIQELQRQKILLGNEVKNWKSHVQSIEVHINELVNNIQQLKKDNNRLKQQIQGSKTNNQQITSLKSSIRQYQIEIKELRFKYQNLSREKDNDVLRWQQILNKNNQQHSVFIREFETKVRTQCEITIMNLQVQLNQIQRELNASKKQVQRLTIQLKNAYQITNQQNNVYLQRQIANLKCQLQAYKNQKTADEWQRQINNLKASLSSKQNSIQQLNIKIGEFSQRIQNLSYQLSVQQSKWKDNLRKNDQEHVLHIQKIQIQISQKFRLIISDLNTQLQQQTRNIEQYSEKISYLQRQNQQLLIKLQTYSQIRPTKQWQRQILEMREHYQTDIADLWGKLQIAEQHILKITNQLTDLQGQNIRLHAQIRRIKEIQIKEDYLYKLDPKYLAIMHKLRALSTKNNQTIQSQSQFWENYRLKRKRDLQQMQQNINSSLQILLDVQQAIIIKKSQLYRLDLLKLQDLLKQINNIKQSKKFTESQIRQNIQSQFYGLLQAVAVKQSQ